MKVIILAGGYAKRLWPLTKEQPKHLLPIAGKPMIDYLMTQLDKLDVDRFYLVTNAKFARNFEAWAEDSEWKDKVVIINDQTSSDEDRLGSLGDIMYAVRQESIEDDIFVQGADNLSDFDFNKMVQRFQEKQAPVIAAYDVKDPEIVKQNSQVTVGESQEVLEYLEKPESPTSTLVGTLSWIIPKDCIPYIQETVDAGRSDKAGWFIIDLLKRVAVYSVTYDGLWIDIGTPETYEKAQETMKG